MKYGEAIEIIKNEQSFKMYRDAWHGKKIGHTMYIQLSDVEFDGITTKVFRFVINDVWYAWTPSQHDMLSDDWTIDELQ